VLVRGPVGRAIRAVGGTVSVEEPVGTDALLWGGVVALDPGARVGRDLVAAGSTV